MSLENAQLKVLLEFERYLIRGYYPYFKEMEDELAFQITIQQNIEATLEVDLVALYPHLSGITIQKIKSLLLFIAQSVPFTPSWERLKEIISVGDTRTVKAYFQHLEKAHLIKVLPKASSKIGRIDAAGKVYLDNTNLLNALALQKANSGTMRETFFLSMVGLHHQAELPLSGDFLVDSQYLFEIGGRKKGFEQIKDHQQAFCACDDMERGAGNKIPLWLFGFLY